MEKDYSQWLMEKRAEKCVENLKRHGFDAHACSDGKVAGNVVADLTRGFETFGIGGSDTVRSLGIAEELKRQGETVHDHWQPGLTPEQIMAIRLAQGRCDCFLCSANGISMTGEIVNVDGIGNRTSAMAFGPKKVIIVAGMNKVTEDLASAVARVRQVAGPMRARSLSMETPCAKTGICSDCNVPQRICNITTILHRRPMLTDMSVVLVNASLGF
ncbi:MAG: lactate utilization protein [Desulfobacterales bacterium]|nr:lactate utilization protein [Desulfobacterales bacterium]